MSMKDYSRHVHRSLIQRDLMMGIPPIGLLLLMLIVVLFVYIFQIVLFLIPVVILYIAMRIMTKKDPYFVDIIVDNITQKERLIP